MLPPSAKKHKLRGIGEAAAASLMAAMAANPTFAVFTQGFLGKITFWILTRLFSSFASMGLVLLNVGAEKVLIASEKVDFDGSFEAGEKLIEAIRESGRELTPEEIARIDTAVIIQLRRFAKLTRKKGKKR